MTLGVARDIALIIIIVPTLICALLPAGLAFGMWWAARRARFGLTGRIRATRTAVRRSRDVVDRVTRTVTRPVFYTHTQSARWRAMWRALRTTSREK